LVKHHRIGDTALRRAHFAYACFKIAGSIWNVLIVVGAVSGQGGKKAAYSVIVALLNSRAGAPLFQPNAGDVENYLRIYVWGRYLE
jgi:hypothetical protein